MDNHTKFYFNPEEGSAMCVISHKARTYVGTAKCAEADKDMMNEITGCEIARHRAIIKILISRRDELKLELNSLKKFQYTINQSKYYDSKSYIARMLQRKINQYEDDLEITKELLSERKQILKEYLNEKAEFYTKIRKRREQGKNN